MRLGAQSVQTAIRQFDEKILSGFKRNHLAIYLHVDGCTVLTSDNARPFCRAFKRPPGSLGKFCFWF